jgi:hypothetical protein
MGGLSGIKAAPDYLPESVSGYPFIVAYEGQGEWTWHASASSYGEFKWVGSVVIELHIARKDMPRDVQQAVYYSRRIPEALWKKGIDKAGVTFNTMAGPILSSGLIGMEFNTVKGVGQTVGYRYTIQGIKARTEIT